MCCQDTGSGNTNVALGQQAHQNYSDQRKLNDRLLGAIALGSDLAVSAWDVALRREARISHLNWASKVSETFESRQREANTTRSDRPISSEGLVPAPLSSPENSHRIQRAWFKCARHAKGCLLTCSTDASVKAPLIIGTSVAPPAKCRNPPWGPSQGRPPTSQATPRAEGGMPASRGPGPPTLDRSDIRPTTTGEAENPNVC